MPGISAAHLCVDNDGTAHLLTYVSLGIFWFNDAKNEIVRYWSEPKLYGIISFLPLLWSTMLILPLFFRVFVFFPTFFLKWRYIVSFTPTLDGWFDGVKSFTKRQSYPYLSQCLFNTVYLPPFLHATCIFLINFYKYDNFDKILTKFDKIRAQFWHGFYK